MAKNQTLTKDEIASMKAGEEPPPPPPPPPTKTATPTMGRIVMYRSQDGHESPAIVNGVNDDGTVALYVFWRDGVGGKAEHNHVGESTHGEEGWRWPTRA